MVYIISQDGQPLMPTNRHGKVRHLIKDGKAKVVRRCPFTIQLLYSSTSYTQPITLGVGYRKLKLLENRKHLLVERREAVPLTAKAVGFPA